MIKIYHNPQCSKSCAALAVLEAADAPYAPVSYLTDPPTLSELRAIVVQLNCQPFDLVRTSEPLYLAQYADKTLDDAAWLQVLHENPVLIQRPIVVNGKQALLVRSPEALQELTEIVSDRAANK